MFGRRGYQRLEVGVPHGVLRVLRDVVVQGRDDTSWFVLGREAGVIGDILTLDSCEPDRTTSRLVRVAESRLVLVNGSVRHRMRLDAWPGDA